MNMLTSTFLLAIFFVLGGFAIFAVVFPTMKKLEGGLAFMLAYGTDGSSISFKHIVENLEIRFNKRVIGSVALIELDFENVCLDSTHVREIHEILKDNNMVQPNDNSDKHLNARKWFLGSDAAEAAKVAREVLEKVCGITRFSRFSFGHDKIYPPRYEKIASKIGQLDKSDS